MTKVHVSLPNHWLVGGESLWVSPVEGEPQHYTVENVPYFAYGIALGDVVRAVSTAEHPLEAVAVVRRSGSMSYRVMFAEYVDSDRQVDFLKPLHEEHGVSMEKGFPQYWALNVPGDAVEAVAEKLRALRDEKILDLESGDQRVEGSFDADPDQE